MKRTVRVILFLAVLIAFQQVFYRTVSASEFEYDIGGKLFTRYDVWRWFEPRSTDADIHENSFGWGIAFLELEMKYGDHRVFIQPEFTQIIGLPDDAMGSGREGPLGIGAIYYAHSREEDPFGAGLHQAYYQYRDALKDGFSGKIGRFGYTNGLEGKSPSPKINLLKHMRIADRVISEIGWTAFWRSYNGFRLDYRKANSLFTVSLTVPTQGAFEEEFNKFIDDILLGTAVWSYSGTSGKLTQDSQLFYYYYDDSRHCSTRVDNAGKSVHKADIRIHSTGGHYVGTIQAGPGQFDVLGWGMIQFGDWYEQDHFAYAGTLEAGYQFTNIPGKPWLRFGYYRSSGDDDPGDSDHNTFYQLLPGTRKYELLPFYNLMNSEEYFVQLLLRPIKQLGIRMDYHVIDLVEENDLWYMGSGATRNEGEIFGYIGRPTGGTTDLGEEWDLVMNFRPVKWLEFVGSFSYVQGGDLIKEIYADDTASYLMLEARVFI